MLFVIMHYVQVLNSTFLNNLNISCSSVEDSEQVNCKSIENDTSFHNQQVIFIPYNGNLTKKSDLRVTYSSQICVVIQVDIKGNLYKMVASSYYVKIINNDFADVNSLTF